MKYFGIAIIGWMLFFAAPARAQVTGFCYCEARDKSIAECRASSVTNPCYSSDNLECTIKTSSLECDAAVAAFNNSKRNDPAETAPKSSSGLVSKLIPPCALEAELKGECRDITVFFKLMFQIINYLFSIIGGVALLFFVYGGFIFILSEGNSERIEKGKGIIMASVLGIVIAFSGYALVKFVGEVVGIKNEYKIDYQTSAQK